MSESKTESCISKRGIPVIDFVDDVDAFLEKENGATVDQAVKKLEETHQKYKYVQSSMITQRQRYKNKLPELKNSLQLLNVLNEKKEKNESMKTNFLLSDQLYTTATIPPTDKVHLWLGANVMLEYCSSEARNLLERNISSAERGIADLDAELDFIKDQLTTTEVNLVRVYNHGVQKRKQQQSGAN